ncbi:MAG: ferritin-like domain-containing protein [Bacillota bacterium]
MPSLNALTPGIEQQHMDNIAAQIKSLGGIPTKPGDVPAPIAGQIAGKILAGIGTVAVLKANIKLEEKAMQDYKNFLLQAGGDRELYNLLWNNLIDEDLHTAWFASKLRELERIERQGIVKVIKQIPLLNIFTMC